MNTHLTKFLLLLLIIMLPFTLFASLGGDFTVAGVSKYLWRGQVLDDSLAIQPGFDLNVGNLSVGMWGSYSTTSSQLAECDFLISYSLNLPILTFTGGFTYYTFSNFTSKSYEAYITGSMDIFLSPSLTIYDDFGDGDGLYVEGAISYPFNLIKEFDLSATCGYNIHQWGYDSSLTVLGLSFSTTFSLINVNITPLLFYQISLNNQYNNDGYVSIGITYNF